SPLAVRAYVRAAFGTRTDEEIDDVLAHRICSDLREPYATGHANQVLYVQNANDHHVQLQLEPWLEAMGIDHYAPGRITEDIALVAGDWGNGHVAPDRERLAALFGVLLAGEHATWREA